MRSLRGSLWLVLAALLAAAPAAAQLQTGDLFGRVGDTDGQPLPGVTVDLSGVGAPRQAISDEAGEFRFLGLFPGEYRLEASLDGFNRVEYPSVGVRIGSNTEIAVTMTPALAESITAFIRNNRDVTITGLADGLGLGRPTLEPVVGRLVAAGVIRRDNRGRLNLVAS